MYSKIAFGNVKKSFKDYSIYFLTLTLAVSIFYSFNSIESQKAIFEMNQSTSNTIDMLSDLIGGLSVFVSVILGGLILYANNFLIKKRKKELGIYMTLGMGKFKISKILVLETIIVGIASLISGLLIGFVLSQGLSVLTSKLFEANMSEYKFIISQSAIIKTIIYFGIMFLLVMIFNSIVISKYKIIDLLTAGRKNENIKFKNPLMYLITFILCILFLGFAYKFIIDVGLDVKNPKFMISIVFGVLGTLLFFYSLAGALLFIVKKNKKIYFKNLNIFIVKQLNSKINTNFLSISVICLMLFLTIGILSTGISFKNALESSLKNTTPFDASAYMYVNKDDKIKSVKESLDALNFKFDSSEPHVYFNTYTSKVTIADVLGKNAIKSGDKMLGQLDDQYVEFIKISDYNDIRKLTGKKAVNLGSNQVLLMSNNNTVLNMINNSNDKMINKSIFAQTLIYFSLPVSLAFIHSIVGIKVVNEFIALYDKPDIGGSSLFTAIVFIVIYAGYFYATYTGYKNIVKNS